jgi:hypothetical protein
MTKHCFIVTSAINTKFGVYPPAERLIQTVITCRSIRQKVPDALIVIIELAGSTMDPAHEAVLVRESDIFLDFTEDAQVRSIYQSTDTNWDVVKNGTEIYCFGRAVALLLEEGDLQGVDRIHKISGRYVLSDAFDPMLYDNELLLDKIVIGHKHQSQFPLELTGQSWQYMARLWSWPMSMSSEIVIVYENCWKYFLHQLANQGYVDIEHALAKFLPTEHIHEVAVIGLEGTIAPTGTMIKD